MTLPPPAVITYQPVWSWELPPSHGSVTPLLHPPQRSLSHVYTIVQSQYQLVYPWSLDPECMDGAVRPVGMKERTGLVAYVGFCFESKPFDSAR